MALSFFVRRASSFIISPRSAAVRRGQFLPLVRFSTVTNYNIASLIESPTINDWSKKPSSLGIKTPDAFPFDVMEHNDGSLRLLKIRHHSEEIELYVWGDTYQVTDDGNPKISMTARTRRSGMNIEFQCTVEPNMISIHSLKMRPLHRDCSVAHFNKYLDTKGINARMFDILLDYFSSN